MTYVTENRESIQKLFYNAIGGSIKMINKLHLAMIELYKGDAKRIQHFCKVHSYAKLIAETENVDKKCLFTIEAAALTHDIGIHFCEEKYGDCNGKLQEKEGPAIAEKMLKELGFDQDVSDRIAEVAVNQLKVATFKAKGKQNESVSNAGTGKTTPES